MASPTSDSSSTAKGYEPPAKKQKSLLSGADRAEQYLAPKQPGRVHLSKISWYHDNRGGQGVLPFHVHDIAKGICTEGTSKRRYGQVRLVEVPEAAMTSWLSANHRKTALNPLLANFQALSLIHI